jgi:predicted dehydrogenase
MSLRAAIVGVGAIAQGKYLPALAKIPEVDIVAFCDAELDRAEAAAKEHGVPDAVVTADYEKVLGLDVDLVFVLTPNSTHAPLTIAALEAGKHVMCEKPMAMNSQEAAAMVDAAHKAGKVLTIGYQSRFRPDVQYLKALCEEGELGHIYFAKALAVRRRGVPTWGSFLNQEVQGGGPLIDIGTHALDLALWLMNNYTPKTVLGATHHELARRSSSANAWGPWDPDAFTVEDAAFGMVQMADGATLFVEATWALNTLQEGEAQVVLCGTEAGADMADGLRLNGERAGRLYTLLPKFPSRGTNWEAINLANVKNFVDAVRGDAPLVVKPEEALVVTQVIEALYRSSAAGEPLAWSAAAPTR